MVESVFFYLHLPNPAHTSWCYFFASGEKYSLFIISSSYISPRLLSDDSNIQIHDTFIN